ncbi:nucleotidyltransferase domain-containing protein [Pseudonocardia sp. TRM90224]|uniref:nucleotidyltransferase domain-containing protein n=1 Tax=Pseudonocardia sp. TRM90224 TaxID=2812678 RepID=UPI001E5DFF73|nr:nucleotidyltransferase domain-containing protein [Pseudonocardia sp. TRM90224]
MNLPAEVERATSTYLALADDRLLGLVEGLYLHGSLRFGEFHPARSDIDFVAVVAERPDAEQVVVLGEVLGEVARQHPRPHFDGVHVLRTDLAAIPSGCPDVPCFHEGRFDPAGRFELSPVTWHELAWHGVTVRGEPLRESDVWTDRARSRPRAEPDGTRCARSTAAGTRSSSRRFASARAGRTPPSATPPTRPPASRTSPRSARW